MSEIYIDCDRYRNAVGTLRRLSADLGNERTALTAIMGFVGESWQGGASDAFLEANEWAVKDMERLRFDMEDLAADIETAVTAFEDAERRIQREVFL